MAQIEYKRTMASNKIVDWKLVKKCNCEVNDEWHEYETESAFVLENEDCKVLWNLSIQTHPLIEVQRPDFVAVGKESRTSKMIDFATTRDSRTEDKEKENIEKCQ